ncbi:MAG TPA: hypothetical protein PLY73_14045, partial [Candidatus Ozemobacteraceae bacterium]|nr:hypothetical protein [Candidatus Ozemobacteraceae bacterium]
MSENEKPGTPMSAPDTPPPDAAVASPSPNRSGSDGPAPKSAGSEPAAPAWRSSGGPDLSGIAARPEASAQGMPTSPTPAPEKSVVLPETHPPASSDASDPFGAPKLSP